MTALVIAIVVAVLVRVVGELRSDSDWGLLKGLFVLKFTFLVVAFVLISLGV